MIVPFLFSYLAAIPMPIEAPLEALHGPLSLRELFSLVLRQWNAHSFANSPLKRVETVETSALPYLKMLRVPLADYVFRRCHGKQRLSIFYFLFLFSDSFCTVPPERRPPSCNEGQYTYFVILYRRLRQY